MFSYTKIVLSVALFAIAQAGYLGGLEGGYGGGSEHFDGGYGGGQFESGQHIELGGHEGGHENYHAYPKYQFNYAVHDPHTGDEKQHIEERDGDEVKGTYSLKEADGTTRIVEYKADKHNGFNAVVHKVGEPHHQAHGGGYEGGYGGGYGGHF